MVRPSGETSSDIQVPVVVTNSMSRDGPCFAETSHLAGTVGVAVAGSGVWATAACARKTKLRSGSGLYMGIRVVVVVLDLRLSGRVRFGMRIADSGAHPLSRFRNPLPALLPPENAQRNHKAPHHPGKHDRELGRH